MTHILLQQELWRFRHWDVLTRASSAAFQAVAARPSVQFQLIRSDPLA